ncbi:MAG: hypothetical protein AMS17_19755 [Spirochaetes bacterium DG_61]|nr:MAG: hypothetical protein AMS17_19755 [Spirochaetes bacterium DG_61]
MSKEKRKSEEADSEFIEVFLAGDDHAFDALVLKYQLRIVNLCYRVLGDYEDAVDCAQETFVKVFRSLKSFRYRSSFSTWLFRIAVNTCKNRLASAKYRFHRRMVRLDRGQDGSEDSLPLEVPNGSSLPANNLEKKEREALIQQAIDSLPKEQRTALVLRDIEGLSYEEVARITGLALGTVKSRIARAREQLRTKLKGIL